MPFGLGSIAGLVAGRAAHQAAVIGRRVVFFLLGGLCLLVVLGFLAAALFTWLNAGYGIFAAELGLAAVFLLIGLIFLLAGAMTGRSKKHQPAADPFGFAGQSIPAPALLVAFALGFLQGTRRRR
jgi:hypothetical protein